MSGDFQRINRLPPYVFNIVGELKAEARRRGEDIIDFGMGNPDQDTPKHIVDKLRPILESIHYVEKYQQIEGFFEKYGFWIVFLAGFSPIPYKLFTVAAGATSMALFPFIVASLIGRGARFYLVAGLMKWGGARYESKIRQSVDWLGYAFVGLILIYFLYKYL